MASVEELIIKLSADNSDLKKKLADSEKSVGGLGKAVGAIGPMIAGAFTIGAITSFAVAAFKSAEQQMQVNKRLLFSIKGNTVAFKQLADQAEKLRAATGVDDAAIMQIQTLGGAAGYSTEKIKKITQAAVELAAVTGQDLQAAYMQVNATFNGSAGRLTRLDAEFGTLSEAQLRNGGAVDLLIKKYEGFAAASATETAKLSSNWDEFTERLGTATLPMMNSIFGQMNKDMTVMSDTSLTFWERWTTSQKGLLALIKERKDLEEKDNAARNAAIVKGQAGFLQTAAGIQMVADKTAELRKNSKFLNAETESGTKEIKNQTTAIDSWVEAYEKSLFLKQYDVPAPLSVYMQTTKSPIIPDNGDYTIPDLPAEPLISADLESQMAAQMEYTNSLRDQYTQRRILLEDQLASGIISYEQYKAAMKKVDQEQTNSQIQLVSGMLGTVQSLFGENTLAYKGIAIAQAIMNTYLGATAAMAAGLETGGPAGLILGPAMATVTVAAGLANVAKIAGAFAMGGIVGGGSYSGDQLTARVNSGEMILNGNQQRELFAMANGMGGRNQVEVVGYISGDVIRLANKRSEYILNRRG
jgi:hypothetical protein